MWLLATHVDEVRSDMSVLHRISDLEAMEATRLVAFAVQLVHYAGAVQAVSRAELARRDRPEPLAPEQPVAPQPAPQQPGVREVPATKAAASIDPILSQLISWG